MEPSAILFEWYVLYIIWANTAYMYVTGHVVV